MRLPRAGQVSDLACRPETSLPSVPSAHPAVVGAPIIVPAFVADCENCRCVSLVARIEKSRCLRPLLLPLMLCCVIAFGVRSILSWHPVHTAELAEAFRSSEPLKDTKRRGWHPVEHNELTGLVVDMDPQPPGLEGCSSKTRPEAWRVPSSATRRELYFRELYCVAVRAI